MTPIHLLQIATAAQSAALVAQAPVVGGLGDVSDWITGGSSGAAVIALVAVVRQFVNGQFISRSASDQLERLSKLAEASQAREQRLIELIGEERQRSDLAWQIATEAMRRGIGPTGP